MTSKNGALGFLIQSRNDAESERLQWMWDQVIGLYDILTRAAMDITVTVFTGAIAFSIYQTFWPQLFSWGAFVTASIFMILLLLRIVRRGAFTIQEIGDCLVAMDAEINERLAEICRNV